MSVLLVTVDDLEQAVDAFDERTVLVLANEIRDLAGESRLKSLARERVQERLQQHALLAIPQVPGEQWSEVTSPEAS